MGVAWTVESNKERQLLKHLTLVYMPEECVGSIHIRMSKLEFMNRTRI